jgi:hypothetical protein
VGDDRPHRPKSPGFHSGQRFEIAVRPALCALDSVANARLHSHDLRPVRDSLIDNRPDPIRAAESIDRFDGPIESRTRFWVGLRA